jgi:APA family basic amino acid/polyamine antiporter
MVTREIGAITATGIVVANMIGAGIFTTTGILAGLLPGPVWIIGCWALGGLIAIVGALCYAELATRMPEEGGEYVYLKRLYHPALGFLTGWTSFIVGFSVPIAASAMGFAEYTFANLIYRFGELSPALVALLSKLIAISVIVLFTGLHYLGVRLGGAVQNGLTVVKIIIVLGLATGGMLVGGGGINRLLSTSAEPTNLFGIGTAMMLVMFAYSGWNASAYIAGEIRRPQRTLPISLLTGTVIVILLYLAINTFILNAVPYDDLKGTIAVVEVATVAALGIEVGSLLGLLVGVALLSSLSAFIMIGPRVYYAMAQDRMFFSFAAKVHPRFGVPGRSILIQGCIAVAMVTIGSFEQLLVYIGFALGIFPCLAVAGIFIARRRKIGDSTAVKVWGYPVTPVLFLVASLTLMAVAWINRPLESTAAIVTVLIGVPCYFLVARVAKQK